MTVDEARLESLSIPEIIKSRNKDLKNRIENSESIIEINAITTLIVMQERMRTSNFVTPSYVLQKGGDQRPDFSYELRETQK